MLSDSDYRPCLLGGRVEEGGVMRQVTGPKIWNHNSGMLRRGELPGKNLV